MTARILDGKQIAAEIRSNITTASNELASKLGRQLKLTVFLVGDDPASHTYVAAKQRACATAGIEADVRKLPAETSQQTLTDAIRDANRDPHTDGMIVQLPLPNILTKRRSSTQLTPPRMLMG